MNSRYDGCARRDLDLALSRCGPAFERLRDAHIFITGGTGFFGRWLLALVAYAHAQYGVRATVLTRSVERAQRDLPELANHESVALVQGDVRYFEFPKGRFTHIVHAAADTSVAADRDPATLIDTIVGGTRRVLEFAASAGALRLLYVSSGAIYGAQPADLAHIPETWTGAPDPLDPRSAYGQAKRLAEQMCVCAAAQGKFAPVIARAFAFAGPGLPLDGHFAVGNFIRDALAGRDIVVSGDGTPLRSYLYAGDLAAWLVTLLARGEANRAYNVGSDAAISIADLARRVADLAPQNTGVEIRGKAAPGAPRARYIPSIEAARNLGLDAWTPLDAAIEATMRFAETQVSRGKHGVTQAPRNEHGGKTLTFVIDVDGVVASLSPGNDYNLAEPLHAQIEAINRLFAQGHRIVMFTARGSATGMDWRETTQAQFARWGLDYHELHFGKPAADYYIDDRLLPIGALHALSQNT
ncbi:MAG: NAD-dependent epimerase/dehydratase family protein [Rhodoblastus sp.]